MRVWTSLVSLLILHLQFCSAGFGHEPLKACRNGYVCAIFLPKGSSCKVNGNDDPNTQGDKGYYWESIETTYCNYADYGSFYAGVSIKPESQTMWNVLVQISDREDDDSTRQKPKDVSFDFGNGTKLSFPDVNDFKTGIKAKFVWKKGEKEESSEFTPTISGKIESAGHILLFKSEGYTIYEYLFQIEAKGEKLLNFFSDTVTLGMKGGSSLMRMKDERFLNFLTTHRRTDCITSDIPPKVCFGCDEITDNDSSKNETEEAKERRASYGPLNCSTTAWYHPADDMFMRSWKSFDYIKCEKGTWYAKWTNETDSVTIDKSVELQCSSSEPHKMTQTMSLTLGIGGAAVVLIIAAVVGLVIRWHFKARNAKRSDSQTKSHGTTSKAAGTPSGKA